MPFRDHKIITRVAVLLAGVLLGGCAGGRVAAPAHEAPPVEAHEQLNSVLWVRTSVEYQAVCQEAFRLAMVRLDEALSDPDWSALPDQTGGYGKLPPAVIVDVDETVLDNSPFEARLILELEEYNKPMWDAWIAEEAAPPVPGSQDFIQHALSRGVEVFFVTNRDSDTKGHTVANLREHFGDHVTADHVLTHGEQPGWTSGKTSRRKHVASTHRVLLLVGDNLNDFAYLEDVPPDTRLSQARQYSDYWGTKWIMLPNPMYGTWEEALYGYDGKLDRSEKITIKHSRLQPIR
jgi:5'-nucleotidase (lipoprotein e(P4) family)